MAATILEEPDEHRCATESLLALHVEFVYSTEKAFDDLHTKWEAEIHAREFEAETDDFGNSYKSCIMHSSLISISWPKGAIRR